MSLPLAYHITWTTYGTWLPGDSRGWVRDEAFGILPSEPETLSGARHRLREVPVILDESQREIVRSTIEEHCRIRDWHIHALNVRTNHIHLIVTSSVQPETIMCQLKAWCSRRLSAAAGVTEVVAKKAGRRRWFTEHGSTKWINDNGYLEQAIHYVLHGQDHRDQPSN
ncbi:hypothetical protein GC163_16400 [bacterium]|nr:hypothetical protein [bacterium]